MYDVFGGHAWHGRLLLEEESCEIELGSWAWHPCPYVNPKALQRGRATRCQENVKAYMPQTS